MKEQKHGIESVEQFDAMWRNALFTRPALLMADINPDDDREVSSRVNASLRERFGRKRS